ncbi:MAG: immunoglobulin-like domain-containing protein [Hyalangium sp.]|uniref:immunoglobulin-like domain-containing protein n=1 Tax=Hyalangium sp. TaxID=2028555 RepID=UPI00389AD39E
MKRANLWNATLLMVTLAAIACGQEERPQAQQEHVATRKDALSTNKALILGRTVSSGLSSPEAIAAKKFGLTVDVVTDAQWSSMTAAQFAAYRLIILGDASCASLDAVSAAVANRSVWGRVVNGSVFIAGTAPVANHAPQALYDSAMRFAAYESGNTGLYVSLSCYYQNVTELTHVALLEPFGDFTVQSGNCAKNAHIVASDPDLDAINDDMMSNWSCSVGTQFAHFPVENFAPWSIAMIDSVPGRAPPQGVRDFVDGSFGAPYILARGAVLNGCGNWDVEVGEGCDDGYETNGLAGTECSSTCQLNWCGNGIKDPGEDCDDGENNGTSLNACPRSCRILPPPASNRPPVVMCRNATMSAGPTCGGVGFSIDNGSTDPDGDAINCVQSVSSFEVGTTKVTLTCTDSKGLSASCTGSVTVQDDVAPSISCPAASTFECGVASAPINPPQAQDNCTTPTMTYTLAGESFALGAARQVNWKASDGFNEATCSTSVTMVDTLAPSLAIKGGAQQLECGVSAYTELGAAASDACAGDLSAKVAISGAVNTAAVGSYPVSYSVVDPAGHSVSAVRMVQVADTLAPALALNGASAVALECGAATYTEAGATASDACAGDLSAKVAISGTVNAAAVGSYPVSYSVADLAGHSVSAVRTVSVTDTQAPVVSLMGAPALKLECGVDSFTNQGATATDLCSGNLTSAIVTSGSVNTAAVGNYSVTYKATDAAGLVGSAVRSVQVADTKAPALVLKGASAVAVECGVGQYTEPGATAVDACAGDLSSKVSISGAVDAAARGAYSVSYSVADAAGNVASAVRTVSVNDTLAPVVSLVGLPALKLECGVDSFVDSGATAVDACSGALVPVKAGSVNTAAVGNYAVSYSATDAAGLTSSAVRSVQVADTKAPALTLKGLSTMTLECGAATYTEAGATASDACTGDLSAKVAISGAVNTAARGTYSVNYSVADASGNAASTVRTVSVTDTQAPVISLVGAASMTLTRGSTFVDPGATATDVCSGSLVPVKTGSVNTAVAGTYTLTYKATDAAGLSASVTRTVTVADSCKTTVTVKPVQQIWPPNHKYQDFSLSDCAAIVTTSCGDNQAGTNINAAGTILSIYSDEVEDSVGNGDGSTLDDIVITGPSSFQLRAEREGKGNGRVYGVRFKVTDSAGAVQTAMCKFAVPHDQGDTNVVDDGAAAGYTVNSGY